MITGRPANAEHNCKCRKFDYFDVLTNRTFCLFEQVHPPSALVARVAAIPALV
jgi:hypothetical protein